MLLFQLNPMAEGCAAQNVCPKVAKELYREEAFHGGGRRAKVEYQLMANNEFHGR